MNKLFLSFCLVLTSVAGFAANKIQMVTYFPIPYVAYSKITPKNQLDVGLTSVCEMNVGSTGSGYSLRATTANLNRNRLDLNGAAAVSSANVTIGSGYGPANIDFAQNLRVGTLDRGYSLETNKMDVDSLALFPSHMKAGGAFFPDCKAKSGEERVSWQKLTLKDKEEVYLVCGTPKDSVCNPPAGDPTSQPCPSGYTGTQTRTWNYSSCSWNAWQGTCTCNPPAGEPTSQACPSGQTGTQTRTWNYSTCSWNAWQGTCTAVKGKWVRTGFEEELCMCDKNCRLVRNGPSPVGSATAGAECSGIDDKMYVRSGTRTCGCIRDGLNMGPCTITVPQVNYTEYTCQL